MNFQDKIDTIQNVISDLEAAASRLKIAIEAHDDENATYGIQMTAYEDANDAWMDAKMAAEYIMTDTPH